MTRKNLLVIAKDVSVVATNQYEHNLNRKILDYAMHNKVTIDKVAQFTQEASVEGRRGITDLNMVILSVKDDQFENRINDMVVFVELFNKIRENWDLINETGVYEKFNSKPRFRWNDRKNIFYIFTFLFKEYGIRSKSLTTETDKDLDLETFSIRIPSNIRAISKKFDEIIDPYIESMDIPIF